MKGEKYCPGQRVIVNTGGENRRAIIDHPIVERHGYYWKEQGAYLCRYTEDLNRCICAGAVIPRGNERKDGVNYVHPNSQYIPAQNITATK